MANAQMVVIEEHPQRWQAPREPGPAVIERDSGTSLGDVLTGVRAWLLGVAAIGTVITVAVFALSSAPGGDDGAQPPRVRASVPGLDIDLFADPSGSGDGVVSDVIIYDGIDQLRAAFNADVGHPRLILLVDPI